MKHWHHPTNSRLSSRGIPRLFLAGLLGLSPLSAQGGDWQGVYAVSAIDPARLEQEFTQLSSLGVNMVIQNVSLDEDNSDPRDRKSTRLNSSHLGISYAVFCL